MRLTGEIERRLLVDYRVDPEAAARLLPDPFRPQTVAGAAVAGICRLRLGSLRPPGVPALLGRRSENAAHRIAVEWDTPDGTRTGVYIPRRDSGSALNVAVGGRLFPGEHHRSDVEVDETADRVAVAFRARDGGAEVDVAVRLCDTAAWRSVVFDDDVEAASRFFAAGSHGFSATRDPGRFDGLALQTDAWRVEPAAVEHARSSFFDDRRRFPPGTAVLDDALVMRRVPVGWRSLPSISGGDRSPTGSAVVR